jgi:flagellar motor switch protein FliN/FliY
MPLLMGVKLPIRILLGRTQLALRDVAQLGSGAVVELDCSPDDPVEIIVNDRVIAYGEVVVVSGNYGVRITKINSRRQDRETDSSPSDLFSLSQRLR